MKAGESRTRSLLRGERSGSWCGYSRVGRYCLGATCRPLRTEEWRARKKVWCSQMGRVHPKLGRKLSSSRVKGLRQNGTLKGASPARERFAAQHHSIRRLQDRRRHSRLRPPPRPAETSAIMSQPSLAKFIIKRPWLRNWVQPLANWYGNAAGYRQLGLRCATLR